MYPRCLRGLLEAVTRESCVREAEMELGSSPVGGAHQWHIGGASGKTFSAVAPGGLD